MVGVMTRKGIMGLSSSMNKQLFYEGQHEQTLIL